MDRIQSSFSNVKDGGSSTTASATRKRHSGQYPFPERGHPITKLAPKGQFVNSVINACSSLVKKGPQTCACLGPRSPDAPGRGSNWPVGIQKLVEKWLIWRRIFHQFDLEPHLATWKVVSGISPVRRPCGPHEGCPGPYLKFRQICLMDRPGPHYSAAAKNHVPTNKTNPTGSSCQSPLFLSSVDIRRHPLSLQWGQE